MDKLILELSSRLDDLRVLVKETNKMPILIMSQHPSECMKGFVSPNIRESISNVICFVEIGDEIFIPQILQQVQGCVDRIILDIDDKRPNSQKIINAVLNYEQTIPLLLYSDLDVWGNTSVDFVAYKEGGLRDKSILICGNSLLSSRIIIKLIRYGAQVYVRPEEYEENLYKCDNTTSITIDSKNLHFASKEHSQYDVVIGVNIFTNTIMPHIEHVSSIYDIGLNNFSHEYISMMREKGASVYRYDNRAGISSVLLNLLETEYLIKYNMGEVRIGNVDVISGGIMGTEGAIVVDNAYNPQFIVGVANGCGIIKPTNELHEKDKQNIELIKNLLLYGQ